MNMIGSYKIIIGICVNTVHVRLVTSCQQRPAIMVALARANETHEQTVGGVIFIVAPVDAALAEPIAIV